MGAKPGRDRPPPVQQIRFVSPSVGARGPKADALGSSSCAAGSISWWLHKHWQVAFPGQQLRSALKN